jgi:hypothetical protein
VFRLSGCSDQCSEATPEELVRPCRPGVRGLLSRQRTLLETLDLVRSLDGVGLVPSSTYLEIIKEDYLIG